MEKFIKMTVSYIDSSRGVVLGLGAKIFTIAGPVIVYGTAASVIYGGVYWIYRMFL